ncbi:carbohydrate porin [Massilia sp. PWRC2]|uniref:carbohydrate porin n=1 Tax=Massilia sp. PWRC2 TaxID=2804626 RepID=UPI003CF1DE58
MHYMNELQGAVLAAALLAALPVQAQTPAGSEEAWNLHAQSTYIWQKKASFAAPYSGINSLSTAAETSYSFSATAALGWRAWSGGELYVNPELVQGVPLSNLTGLGGMSNGEQQKTGGPHPTLYRARLFARHSIALGGARVQVESDSNQLAGMVDQRRIVVTAGNLALIDIFDNNALAHDPRTQFMNWALLAHGAYDFAADARGYSNGAAVEWYWDAWVLRAGRFMQPAQSNGLALDRQLRHHFGDQLEVSHSHAIAGRAGSVRLLAFHNQAVMGSFKDALAAAARDGGSPDVALVRHQQSKRGAGISVDQEVTAAIGVFARASANDGATETYAFAEIDRSLSAGAVFKGELWQRSADTAGVALVRDGLSGAHRAYLAAGGHGAFVGDGRLAYRPEAIAETYYSVALGGHAWLTFDYQHIANPAYNRARGPVNVGAIRLHAQM